MVTSSNIATPVDNAFLENVHHHVEPNQEGFIQEVELLDNPPLTNEIINSKAHF
jgi:hypothetical protein